MMVVNILRDLKSDTTDLLEGCLVFLHFISVDIFVCFFTSVEQLCRSLTVTLKISFDLKNKHIISPLFTAAGKTLDHNFLIKLKIFFGGGGKMKAVSECQGNTWLGVLPLTWVTSDLCDITKWGFSELHVWSRIYLKLTFKADIYLICLELIGIY